MNILKEVSLQPCPLISLNPRVELLGHRVGICLTLRDSVVGLSKELIDFFFIILKVIRVHGKVSVMLRIIIVKISLCLLCLLWDGDYSKCFRTIPTCFIFTTAP